MSFEPGLEPGKEISNRELSEIFQCGTQGGMRRSRKTGTLVIVSDSTKTVYEDRWDLDGVMHYTGMGLKGEQKLDFSQNRTLAESHKNGVGVYLFEVFDKGRYTYRGKVELAERPYQGEQRDENGELRSVWIFPVRLVEARNLLPLPMDIMEKNERAKKRAAKKLSIEELEKRTLLSSGRSSVRRIVTNYYERNAYVAELAKLRAKGMCQLCELPAPFLGKSGEPYLETHHIDRISNG